MTHYQACPNGCDGEVPLRAFSFGGGVQSVAALVLASLGRIAYRTFLFCNVGEDSENPATLAYLEQHAKPFAAAHGLALVELRKRRGRRIKGEDDVRPSESILGRLHRTQRAIGIPVRMSNGAPGNRTCTVDFKIRVIDSWLREHGATAANPATVGIGFSLDEVSRLPGNKGDLPFRQREYPLILLRLDRAACAETIKAAGLPVPPKSSCWFCPFHSGREWKRMAKEQPAQFAAAVALETLVNERRGRLGRDRVFFTNRLKTLPMLAAEPDQLSLDLDDGRCDSGYCFR